MADWTKYLELRKQYSAAFKTDTPRWGEIDRLRHELDAADPRPLVYALVYDDDFGTSVIGIYPTMDEAKVAKKRRDAYYFDGLGIVEYRLGDTLEY